MDKFEQLQFEVETAAIAHTMAGIISGICLEYNKDTIYDIFYRSLMEEEFGPESIDKIVELIKLTSLVKKGDLN